MRALFSILTFFTLLVLAATAHAQDARQIVTTENGDYFGFDLRTEQNVTLDQCKQACLADNGCRAFTYNSRAKWCFLKSDYNRLNTFTGAVAGKVIDVTAEPDIGAPAELTFVPAWMLDEATRYRTELLGSAQQNDAGLAALVSSAADAIARNDGRFAMFNYTAALAILPDDAKLWTGLANAADLSRPDANVSSYTLQRATTSAAIVGYRLSRTASTRAAALNALAAGLTKRGNHRPAMNAYEASLALVTSPAVQAQLADLKARFGFRVVDHTIDSDNVSPRACIQFSEDLVKSGTDYAQFVTLDGGPATVSRDDRQLCVEGLRHGGEYRIVVRSGLPAQIGEVINEPVALDIYVLDRSPSIRFTGDSFVLPGSARRGIPIVSINTDAAKVSVYRVGERSLAQVLSGSQFLRQLDGYEIGRIGDEIGAPVWQGEIEIATELNKDVVTSFPIDEALPDRKPGVYVMTALPLDDRSESWDSKATQWFVVSDIGLTTFSGSDGLTVFARSLDSAGPIANAELRLIARNNEVLGTTTTDAEGRATLDAGLLRGTSGMAPAALTAANGDDFVFLDMTRAGFDFSDRGVSGRRSPGALDVFAWTERGIYRAGETVYASALARDGSAEAVSGLPLTFIFQRPDGVEDRRIVSDGADLGGHVAQLALAENAMRGAWGVRIHTDPKSSPVAEKTFLVEDFVPDRIEFDLTTSDEDVAVGETAEVEVDGRYLYGAPAAGLKLEGQLTISRTREWEEFPGYVFGLEDEEDVEDSRVSLTNLPTTDDDGKATIEVPVDAVPSTTQLLVGDVTVRMVEGGGRAVERSVDLGIASDDAVIGIKPEFDGGSVPENSRASFRVIAVDPQGERAEMKGLNWALYRVQRNYQWYRQNNTWSYEPITTTELVEDGTVDATTSDAPQIGVTVGWGRYRLEIDTADPDGPASSVDFTAGWYVEASSTETPDGLEIALDKESYAVGDTARLSITSRMAGKALIALGAETILSARTVDIAQGDTVVEIPVTSEMGAGAYALATLYRPGSAADSRMPARAIGVKWLKVEPGERKLGVEIATVEKTQPHQPLEIPLTVTGLAAGEEAYVTVAAVDVGILNLTRYEPPAPAEWYFGQRMLGLEMRDLYGRLIDGSLGVTGRLRTGGDSGEMTPQGKTPTEKLVAFFAGPVRVDAEGKATVAFDIPEFNGTVRVMAVAWSKTGTGSASRDVIVRDPVVLTTSQPRFMAPGDASRLLLEIANTDGPAGEYTVEVTAEGVGVDRAGVPATVSLAQGGKVSFALPLTATEAGNASVTVAFSHPSGISVERSALFPVRPGAMPVTTRQTVTLAANGGSLTVDRELLADSIPQGASVTVGVSRASAFDVPALLMTLDRYPYGCAEQTTSRALPLLYVSELSKTAGMEEDPALRGRVQDAIARVLSYQSSSGSFGLWSPGSGDLWLDSYVTDFLTRAREQNYDVPERAMSQALRNLQNSLAYDVDIASNGNEIAYALYVLARNRKASVGDLRYYSDTQLESFETPLSRAQLAASLALYGDAQRAQKTFGSAYGLAQGTPVGYTHRSDYGTSLRDGAAMLALAAESRPEPALIPDMVDLVADLRRQTLWTSTQDEAWMLLAARAVQQASDTLSLEVAGAPHAGAFSKRLSGEEIAAAPFTVVNRGSDPVDAVLTKVAAPEQPLPAGGDGFAIKRTYYTLDGAEANVTEAKQNERYVVVLEVVENNSWPSRVLVNDLLPAGFEIDNPRLVGSAELANFGWLGQTEAAHVEFRDDRFIAAFNRDSGSDRDFRLAYVVRAVTPGVYMHPAASVEDMYRPALSARTATGMMTVQRN